jgi:hypothetical protein
VRRRIIIPEGAKLGIIRQAPFLFDAPLGAAFDSGCDQLGYDPSELLSKASAAPSAGSEEGA